MPAMNGSAVSFRKGRLIGCCMAVVLVFAALFASSASAAKAPLIPTNYTALGDSLAFGYTAEKHAINEPSEPPAAFEEGYANFLVAKLAKLEKKAGNQLSLINLGCPGEVSDGLIGENKTLGGGGEGNGKPDSNPCAYNNVWPLHFEIGAASQLEAALGIEASPGTFGATNVVTLNIGSNDELAVVKACATPAYDAEHGFTSFEQCLFHEAGEEGTYYEKGLFHHIIANMGDAVFVLRQVGFYAGPIAILGFYNPQAFILPGSDLLQKVLNENVGKAIEGGKFGPGVVFANPFLKFNPSHPKAEEKAIAKYTEECNPNVQNFQGGHAPGCEGDIHPTVKGYKVLATIIYHALGH